MKKLVQQNSVKVSFSLNNIGPFGTFKEILKLDPHSTL
jgi:hypothetical protein